VTYPGRGSLRRNPTNSLNTVNGIIISTRITTPRGALIGVGPRKDRNISSGINQKPNFSKGAIPERNLELQERRNPQMEINLLPGFNFRKGMAGTEGSNPRGS
jgi:hypothetical protein